MEYALGLKLAGLSSVSWFKLLLPLIVFTAIMLLLLIVYLIVVYFDGKK